MNKLTMERLEFRSIQEGVMERAVTYLGKQHAEAIMPMTEPQSIRIALDETEEAVKLIKQGGSVPIPSLEGLDFVFNLMGTGYVYSEEDFEHIRQFLHSCSQLRKYMAAKSAAAPRVCSFAASLHELSGLQSEIERCFRHGRITDDATKELGKIRKKLAVLEERIRQKLQALLARHRSLLQENLYSMRGERYVLPVRREHRKQIAGAVLDESSSGQTVYIEPAELAYMQGDRLELQRGEAREEAKVLGYLTGLVEEAEQELRLNAETVGVYDFLFAKAKFALTYGGVNAELNDRGMIRLAGARHPLLGKDSVPLDFAIGESYRSLIITGPNTGGKTVALKTVGLLTLMLQSGLLVPVQPGSCFAVYRSIAADIGDGQSIEQSLSTFSAHIRNMASILNTADSSTLVLLDEMASGTDPGEGVGLSIAILEELHRRGSTVVATTHFNEIKDFAATAAGFQNARMEFDADTLQPLYRLRIGESGHSYAFHIARKLGIPEELIRRSEEIASRRHAGERSMRNLTEAMEQQREPGRQLAAGHPEKPAMHRRKRTEEADAPKRASSFAVGDSVYIPSTNRTGIVYKEADDRGQVGVMVQDRKLAINHKRLALHIPKQELYPEDYDFDILFESKENRKKRKLMSRKHVEGLTIVKPPEES